MTSALPVVWNTSQLRRLSLHCLQECRIPQRDRSTISSTAVIRLWLTAQWVILKSAKITSSSIRIQTTFMRSQYQYSLTAVSTSAQTAICTSGILVLLLPITMSLQKITLWISMAVWKQTMLIVTSHGSVAGVCNTLWARFRTMHIRCSRRVLRRIPTITL